MSRWFRLYDELLDDPKVQRLHPALFKVLINLWCVASRHDGRLPTTADLSFSLRMTEDETFRAVSKLAEAGFIDADTATGEQRVHGWEARQFRSDVSTDRVRAHRERQKTAKKHDDYPPNGRGAGNDDETFRGTAPDTEADTDYSVAKATGGDAAASATDFCKVVFDTGKALLIANGKDERSAGSLLGRMRKTVGDPEMITLIREAETKSDPAEWLIAAVETRNGRRQPGKRASQSGHGSTVDAAQRALARHGYAVS